MSGMREGDIFFVQDMFDAKGTKNGKPCVFEFEESESFSIRKVENGMAENGE
ncbi:MAG: hypothetical protein LBR22_04205 [Desulfovibrio sp.]|nr:hypothetical protein [Desulfovibrio sp.]